MTTNNTSPDDTAAELARLRMELHGAQHALEEASRERVRASLRADAAEREVAALRAIVEGRTVPPTPQERVAHLCATKRQGLWRLLWGRYDIVGDFSHAVLREALSASDARWWALDADRIPCAWPVVDGVSR